MGSYDTCVTEDDLEKLCFVEGDVFSKELTFVSPSTGFTYQILLET